MRHPHYEIIKEWIEDTSRVVECNHPSTGWCITEPPMWRADTEYRLQPAKKEVVSSMSDDELRVIYIEVGGVTRAAQDRRRLANAAAAQERKETIEWLRKAYPQFDEAVFINLENR